MTQRRFRTVVVGFGKIAAGYTGDRRMARYFDCATHAQALANHPDFEWIGVADPSPKARSAAESWNVPRVAPDAADLADLKPEVAVITTPPGSRPAVLDALPSLRAVFVEKPLSVGDDEGEVFLKRCRERGVAVQVNFWRRGDPLFRELAAGGLRHRVGAPQTAFATYGNGLFNNGGHMVDFVRMLLGEVESAQATGPATEARGPLKGDVQIPFVLALDSGLRVAVHPVDFSHFREVGLDVWGSGGRLALYQESLGIYHYPRAENRGLENEFEIASDAPAVLEPTVGKALPALYGNLAAALDGDQPLWSSGDSARATERVLDAILRSAERGGIAVASGR